MSDRDPDAPPRLVGWLFRILLFDEEETVWGDVEEGYRRRVAERGVAYARTWYRRQAISSLWALRTAWLRRRPIEGWTKDDDWTGREDGMMTTTWRELRYAVRSLRKAPGFTAAALVTLALGLGANTAIFSLVQATLFAAPPVAEADRLVAVYTTSRRGLPRSSTSYPDFLDYRAQATLLVDLAGTSTLPASLGDDERGSRFVSLQTITGNYFELLGVDAAVGRLIAPDDDRLQAGAPVIVLSYELWASHYLTDPGVVGSTVRLNGEPFTVIGVARPGFTGLSLDFRPDAWLPMQSAAALGDGTLSRPTVWEERSSRWMGMSVGRMADGATLDQVRAQLYQVSEQLKERWGDERGPRDTTVDPLASYALPNGAEAQVRRFVWLLMGVVGFTLLLACANLANLVLTRATRRSREIAVRLALGAGRAQLLRQLLLESGLLAVAGGGLGLGVAVLLLNALGGFQLPGDVTVESLGTALDTTVLGFTMGVSVLTALVFGLAPALQASRRDVVRSLKDEGRAGTGRGGDRMRKVLVATQIGLCLVLMIGSGLFVQTLRRGLSADLGFEPEGVALARINLGLLNYETPDAMAFLDELRARLEARPDVEVVSASSRVPLQVGGARGFFMQVPGYQPAPDEELRIDLVGVSPGYFESLGMPILEGRALGEGDIAGGPEVAVVSRSMAERYWAPESAVGRTFVLGNATLSVVGVAEDVTWQTLDEEPTSFVYVPLATTASWSTGFMTIGARTTGNPEALLGPLRSEIVALEADAPITLLTTMEHQVRRVLRAQEMGTVLLSGFGLLSLLLATIGIAGVVTYTVSQQRRQIGIRMALGAESGSVVREVAQGLALPVALGVAAGLAGATLLTRSVEGFLYGVSALDARTYVVVTAALVGVTLVATLVPARKATAVHPVEVLNAE